MKVAFFTHYPKLFGSNRALLALMQGLKAFGVEPLVIIPGKGPMTDKLEALGIPYLTCPFRLVFAKHPRAFDSAKRGWANFWLSLGMARRLRQLQVQAVYSNTIVIDFGFVLGRRLAVPHIWHIREFGDLDYGVRPIRGWHRLRRSLEESSAVITISKAISSHWFADATVKNVHVIYDGVALAADLDARLLAARKAFEAKDPRAPFRFVLVGLLQPAKGQQTAIRALHLLRQAGTEARLVLVGSGDEGYVVKCKTLCAELGVADLVSFAGYVDNTLPFYLKADAGLLCSRAEAYGLVTVECMSCARPVIGHATGATPELIADGSNGLLYSGGAEQLAQCMRQLAENRPLAASLGQNAWRRVKEELGIEQSIAKTLAILESVVSSAETGPHREVAQVAVCQPASN